MIDWVFTIGAPWFSSPLSLSNKERMEKNCKRFYSDLKYFLESTQSTSGYHELELNLQEEFRFDFTKCNEFQTLQHTPTVKTIEFHVADLFNPYVRYYQFERSCNHITKIKMNLS